MSNLHLPTHLRPEAIFWQGQKAQLASFHSLVVGCCRIFVTTSVKKGKFFSKFLKLYLKQILNGFLGKNGSKTLGICPYKYLRKSTFLWQVTLREEYFRYNFPKISEQLLIRKSFDICFF